MRTSLCLGVLMAMSVPCDAQIYPTPSMKKGDHAFACAMAAHIDGGETVYAAEIVRLAQYGYKIHIQGVAELLAIPGMEKAGWHQLFSDAQADFFVGQQWSKAVAAVNTMVATRAPYTDQGNAEWQAQRKQVAGDYYAYLNCGEVGR